MEPSRQPYTNNNAIIRWISTVRTERDGCDRLLLFDLEDLLGFITDADELQHIVHSHESQQIHIL
jgi:hypothetical protein